MHACACLFLLVLLHFYKLNILLQFRGILKMLKSDNDVRVMILRSAVPGVFCAGLWLSGLPLLISCFEIFGTTAHVWLILTITSLLVCFDHYISFG